MQRVGVTILFAFGCALLTGCGGGLVGEYQAEIRLIEGMEESDRPAKSVAAFNERWEAKPCSITLKSDGRYVMKSGNRTNEGTWRVDGDTVVIRDDTSDGNRVPEGLRVERSYVVRNGELVNDRTYRQYNVEEVFVRAINQTSRGNRCRFGVKP